ncbi:MAG TPA: hypothetical protein VL563_08780 [Gemmatimonadales bacterium]|nr:hypothetical protein [Gemmatimonadales bacterium]
MATPLFLLLATLGVGGPAAAAPGTEARAWVREYVATYSTRTLKAAHLMIPAWARKYNMNCSGCHYPAPPRLNATGMRFKWAGYRMPEEIGEKIDVERVQNYVAGHGVMQYEWTKTKGEPSTGAFAVPEVGLFYAGPVGRAFSGFFEFERVSDGTTDLVAHVSGMWGKPRAYGGFRIGQMHTINEWGVAGFDRHLSINDIAPLGTITAAIPFSFDMGVGAEGYYVKGSNRFSVQVTNGIDLTGSGAPGASGNSKDVAVIEQLLYDSVGSAVEAVGYYGTLRGVDTVGAPSLDSHFWRLSLTANKLYKDWEFLGGVVYGKDFDLPTALAFPNNENKGIGYWVSGQYYVRRTPLVLFGRYEFVDPNTDASNDGVRHFVAGAVVPINLPQYLRWTLEYRLDSPQGGLPKTNDLATELQLNF